MRWENILGPKTKNRQKFRLKLRWRMWKVFNGFWGVGENFRIENVLEFYSSCLSKYLINFIKKFCRVFFPVVWWCITNTWEMRKLMRNFCLWRVFTWKNDSATSWERLFGEKIWGNFLSFKTLKFFSRTYSMMMLRVNEISDCWLSLSPIFLIVDNLFDCQQVLPSAIDGRLSFLTSSNMTTFVCQQSNKGF